MLKYPAQGTNVPWAVVGYCC